MCVQTVKAVVSATLTQNAVHHFFVTCVCSVNPCWKQEIVSKRSSKHHNYDPNITTTLSRFVSPFTYNSSLLISFLKKLYFPWCRLLAAKPYSFLVTLHCPELFFCIVNMSYWLYWFWNSTDYWVGMTRARRLQYTEGVPVLCYSVRFWKALYGTFSSQQGCKTKQWVQILLLPWTC